MTKKVGRTRDSARTRERLMTAGAQLFAKCGYEGASIQDIATIAGVNKAMIYHLFESKFGLYRAVIVEAISSISADLEVVQKTEAPAKDRLHMFIRDFYRLLEGRPELPSIMLREYLAGSKQLQGDLLPYTARFFEITKALLEDGIREGEFREVDPHSFHLSLVGSLIFFLVSTPTREKSQAAEFLDKAPPTVDEFIDFLQDLLCRGLGIASD